MRLDNKVKSWIYSYSISIVCLWVVQKWFKVNLINDSKHWVITNLDISTSSSRFQQSLSTQKWALLKCIVALVAERYLMVVDGPLHTDTTYLPDWHPFYYLSSREMDMCNAIPKLLLLLSHIERARRCAANVSMKLGLRKWVLSSLNNIKRK